jgi:hypothetical protein
MKKCPPGVICIENITLVFSLIIIFILCYFIYLTLINKQRYYEKQNIQIHNNIQENKPSDIGWVPNIPYNNDVLLNPYTPPLSDDRYFIPRKIPINISTNISAVDTNYRQVGILTPKLSKDNDKILPLMGRPLYISRSKWQYYTMTDKYNSIKLPILYKNRSCTNEYGCDELLGGENVVVEGYNENFVVTKYDSDTIRYIPFI